MNINKKIIALYGPTASGKTDCAVRLAAQCNGIIVNTDSLQLFKDIPLLTARPNAKEMGGIRHELYGFLEPYDQPNAKLWKEKVCKIIDDNKDKNIILVGGTGLYFMTFLKGLSPIPDVCQETLLAVQDLAKKRQNNFYEEVINYDPLVIDLYHPNDHKRLARALSVFWETGKSITYFMGLPGLNGYEDQTYKIYLKPERDILHDRIEKRFKHMVQNGALEEVEKLIDSGITSDAPVFNALGAKEIFAYFNKEYSFEEMTQRGIYKTRQYAKRQYTWFNHQIIADKIITDLTDI